MAGKVEAPVIARGLTIVCSGPDRLALAVELAAAQAALGGPARLFLTGAAVAAVGRGAQRPALATAAELGAELRFCQSALAEAGLTRDDLGPNWCGSGLVALLAGLGSDRLVTL